MLNFPQNLVQISKNIADNIEDLSIWEGKQPQTIAGVAMFLCVESLGIKDYKVEDIARSVKMAPATIQQGYKEILRVKSQVVPKEYLN